MLFVENQLNTEDLTAIQNFFDEYDKEVEVVEEVQEVTAVSKYMTSLVSGQYKKSVEDIENTHVGNT
ncbi:MAG: hypothetical protein MJ231_04805, partial [bacterium]|nr:hypothetical protein [bacterium]